MNGDDLNDLTLEPALRVVARLQFEGTTKRRLPQDPARRPLISKRSVAGIRLAGNTVIDSDGRPNFAVSPGRVLMQITTGPSNAGSSLPYSCNGRDHFDGVAVRSSPARISPIL